MASSVTGHILDGYTRKGYIKGVEGLYQTVRFKYRPVPYDHREELLERWSSGGAKYRIEKSCDLLADKICEWNMTAQAGTELDCKQPKSYRKLNGQLHARLLDIVLGDAVSDTDPEEPEDDDSVFADKSSSGN